MIIIHPLSPFFLYIAIYTIIVHPRAGVRPPVPTALHRYPGLARPVPARDVPSVPLDVPSVPLPGPRRWPRWWWWRWWRTDGDDGGEEFDDGPGMSPCGADVLDLAADGLMYPDNVRQFWRGFGPPTEPVDDDEPGEVARALGLAREWWADGGHEARRVDGEGSGDQSASSSTSSSSSDSGGSDGEGAVEDDNGATLEW